MRAPLGLILHCCAAALEVVLTWGASSAARAAESEGVELRYEMFGFAGIHIATNRTTLRVAGNSYAVAVDVESRGALSIFVGLTTHSEVIGTLTDQGAHPRSYRGVVRRNGVEVRSWVNYPTDD